MKQQPHFTHNDILDLCHTALADFFNDAARAQTQFSSIDVYNPDWGNIDNDGFLGNAEFYGVRALASGVLPVDDRGMRPSHIDLRLKDGALTFAGMQYRMDKAPYNFDDRLKKVIDFAEKWRAENGGDAYSAPRLVNMPGLKMMALWLAGPENVFIPVMEFHTKLDDPIAVDKTYLDTVRAKSKALREQAKKFDGLSPPGG